MSEHEPTEQSPSPESHVDIVKAEELLHETFSEDSDEHRAAIVKGKLFILQNYSENQTISQSELEAYIRNPHVEVEDVLNDFINKGERKGGHALRDHVISAEREPTQKRKNFLSNILRFIKSGINDFPQANTSNTKSRDAIRAGANEPTKEKKNEYAEQAFRHVQERNKEFLDVLNMDRQNRVRSRFKGNHTLIQDLENSSIKTVSIKGFKPEITTLFEDLEIFHGALNDMFAKKEDICSQLSRKIEEAKQQAHTNNKTMTRLTLTHEVQMDKEIDCIAHYTEDEFEIDFNDPNNPTIKTNLVRASLQTKSFKVVLHIEINEKGEAILHTAYPELPDSVQKKLIPPDDVDEEKSDDGTDAPSMIIRKTTQRISTDLNDLNEFDRAKIKKDLNIDT